MASEQTSSGANGASGADGESADSDEKGWTVFEEEKEFEGPRKESATGNRKDPDHGKEAKSTDPSFGPLYEKKSEWGPVYTNKEGKDDKTFYEALKAKASIEALSGSVSLQDKTAKLTLVKAKAEATALHGEFDLGGWIKNLLFGEEPKPETPPSNLPPMAARRGDKTAHGAALGPGAGSPNVFIGGRPAWRVSVDNHLCPTGGHGPGAAVIGAPTVLINNAPAARAGDHVVEPKGGPDVIVEGCSTVLIGVMASPPEPLAASDAEKELPWVQFESVVSGDVGTAEAELAGVADIDLAKGKGMVEAKAGALAAVFKGELPLKLRIRIPNTSYYVGLGVSAEGTLLSAGAEAGAGVKINDGKKLFEATGGAKAGAGIGGVGFKFAVDVSE